jgi:hypothetical protein
MDRLGYCMSKRKLFDGIFVLIPIWRLGLQMMGGYLILVWGSIVVFCIGGLENGKGMGPTQIGIMVIGYIEREDRCVFLCWPFQMGWLKRNTSRASFIFAY